MRRVVRLPSRSERTKMCLRVWTVGRAWCRTQVLLGVPEKGWVPVELPPEGSAEVGVVNRLAIEYRMARISPGKPPRARGRIGQ